MRFGWVVGSVVFASMVACSSTEPASSSPDAGASGDASLDAAVVDASGRDGSLDAAVLDATTTADASPCSPEALDQFSGATTYYVAIGEPGADDDACDGLSPEDLGGGHCPFRDFESPRTAQLLDGARGVRVAVRTGTYLIHGWAGLRVAGLGDREEDRVVLTAYRGEPVVFDTPSPDGALCMNGDPMTNPDCVREVVRISGTYTAVQGITIQHGLAYAVEITGGAHHLFQCNTVRQLIDFSQRSDLVKLDADASDVVIAHNDLSAWHSQAIDMTGVHDVLIEDNDFHDPHDPDGGATGAKFGTRDVTIRGNRIHDLGPSRDTHVFSLGGTGTPGPFDRPAARIHVLENRISNVPGIVAQVVACLDCSIERNDVSNVGAGFLLSAAGTHSASCAALATGCEPTSGARIVGNRLRDLVGDGMGGQADVFVAVEAGEGAGFEAGDNLYCASTAAAAKFMWEGDVLDFEGWKTRAAADATSTVRDRSDPACAW